MPQYMIEFTSTVCQTIEAADLDEAMKTAKSLSKDGDVKATELQDRPPLSQARFEEISNLIDD